MSYSLLRQATIESKTKTNKSLLSSTDCTTVMSNDPFKRQSSFCSRQRICQSTLGGHRSASRSAFRREPLVSLFEGKVFLMTKDDRYQQYEMTIHNDTSAELCFKQVKANVTTTQVEASVVRHQLGRIHICSIDSPSTKVYCQSERHFGCRSSTPTSHRSLFFLSHQQMLDGVNFLLQA